MILIDDNLYFGRVLASGDVRLLKLPATPAQPPNVGDVIPDAVLDVILPAEIWCALVAGVSRLGNTDNRAYRAQLFHAGL